LNMESTTRKRCAADGGSGRHRHVPLGGGVRRVDVRAQISENYDHAVLALAAVLVLATQPSSQILQLCQSDAAASQPPSSLGLRERLQRPSDSGDGSDFDVQAALHAQRVRAANRHEALRRRQAETVLRGHADKAMGCSIADMLLRAAEQGVSQEAHAPPATLRLLNESWTGPGIPDPLQESGRRHPPLAPFGCDGNLLARTGALTLKHLSSAELAPSHGGQLSKDIIEQRQTAARFEARSMFVEHTDAWLTRLGRLATSLTTTVVQESHQRHFLEMLGHPHINGTCLAPAPRDATHTAPHTAASPVAAASYTSAVGHVVSLYQHHASDIDWTLTCKSMGITQNHHGPGSQPGLSGLRARLEAVRQLHDAVVHRAGAHRLHHSTGNTPLAILASLLRQARPIEMTRLLGFNTAGMQAQFETLVLAVAALEPRNITTNDARACVLNGKAMPTPGAQQFVWNLVCDVARGSGHGTNVRCVFDGVLDTRHWDELCALSADVVPVLDLRKNGHSCFTRAQALTLLPGCWMRNCSRCAGTRWGWCGSTWRWGVKSLLWREKLKLRGRTVGFFFFTHQALVS